MADQKAGGSRLGCIIGGCLGAILLVGGGFAVLALIGGLGMLGGLTFLGAQLDSQFDEVAAAIDQQAVEEARLRAEAEAKAAADAAAAAAGTATPDVAPAGDPATPAAGDAGAVPAATTTPATTTTTTTTTTTAATTTPPPKPVEKPTTTASEPKPVEKPATTGTDPPPSTGAMVAVGVDGDATVALIQAKKKFKIPGDVPAGKYEIEATFPGEAPVRTGSVTIAAGAPVTITCRQSMGICRAK